MMAESMNSDLNLRKRGREMSHSHSPRAGNSKLGETVAMSPKRSYRFSSKHSQISDTNKSDHFNSNDHEWPDLDGKNQDSDRENAIPPQPTYPRNWHHTGLGTKIANNEYKMRSRNTILTVMSYNILADYLAQRHPELYNQVEIDWVHIEWNIRFKRILKELQQHNCDIICLQEVQDDHYVSQINPALNELGYDSVFKKRTGDKKDGCAIFYKREKLILLSSTDVEFMQPKALKCLDRDNIGLIAKFMTKKGPANPFCVATTHLLFNPRRIDVKLAQTALLLAEIDRIAWCGDLNYAKYCPVILTGDMNSSSNSAVYELLTQGAYNCHTSMELKKSSKRKSFDPPETEMNSLLPPELGVTDACQHFDSIISRYNGVQPDRPNRLYHSKNSSCDFPEIPEEINMHLGSGLLHHRFGFRSVYDPNRRPPYVSTRQNGYVMVDYIFYSTYFSPQFSKYIEGNLKLLGRLHLYNAEDCQKMGHLPNSTCPSDHLALVSKFLLTG